MTEVPQDYSKYSIQELLEVQRNINPKIAPENYKRLIAELNSRENELSGIRAKEKKEFVQWVISAKSLMKVVGWFQLLGAAFFLIISIYSITHNIYFGNLIFVYFIVGALSLLSFFAGLTLLKNFPVGYHLTLIHQLLQLVSIKSSVLSLSYTNMIALIFHIEEKRGDLLLGVTAKFKSYFYFLDLQPQNEFYFGINMLALAIISYVLYVLHIKSILNRR